MVDFDHLGYDLNRCGGFLDGIQNFIQTCLHHTVSGDNYSLSADSFAIGSHILFVCFDLGFQISNPVIEYRPDPSCMSYMEARAGMP